MLTIKAMAGGETYAAHHLSNNDYYAVGETVIGQWMGNGAKLLGLEGAVNMDDFEAIRQGNNPATNEFLRQRHSADRSHEREINGKTVTETATARNLYDFTVSAPKAVSVQALEDPRLIDAHKTAVAEMAAEMERLAGARIRRGGANDNRNTSNLVISRWDHDTSRELDPQIHTHLVAGNLTYDGAEGRWKALQASDIYAQREYLTEVYRNSLAREVTGLGYQIENRFEHGKDYGFGIVGIKDETLEKYSQRSAQRDAAIAEFMDKNGRLPSNNEVAYLVRETRAEKLAEISTADVKAGQLSRLDAGEAQTLKQLREAALDRGSIREQAPAGASIVYASEHVFERVSVAKDYEIKTEALRHGRGRVELPEVKGVMLAEIASGAMLTARGEVATQASLQRERRMVSTIDAGMGKYEALGRGREFVASDRLRPEQKAAVLAVLASRDLAFNMNGAAGTGKTATLQEVHRGLTEARRSVVAVAPTASAVEELQKVGFPQAMTVARLLADPKEQAQLAGQVLIVDEAGMVASKDMAELIRLAKGKGARILYSGDTAQIKSVSEGDALRVLERESQLSSVSLRQVQRQTNAEYKAAVESLRNHPAEGFAKLEAMGAIREVDWRLRAQEVSKAYREASVVLNAKGEARSVLVVAATHDEIKSITYAVRQDKKRAGELAEGRTFQQHTALNWTEAQKKQTKNYQPGQMLAFHKAVKGVAKNEALEVVSADKSGITARKADGQMMKMTDRQVKAFGVFEKNDFEVAAGDKLLLQANWRDKTFKATNGELVTVASVDEGRISLQDGRQMPAEYRQFTHGYAVTAHRSQGKTVDFEIIAAERMAQDLFYVSATRAREGLTVITSDSVGLQESIGVSGDRQSAMELARRASKAAPSKALDFDDLYQAYQAQQQLSNKPAQPEQILQKEISRDVTRSYSGQGIGF
jgi:conjugative relaxase-like TrwC/TraI family protein